MKLPKSPGLMVSAAGISEPIIISEVSDELCDRIKILFQEKHSGNISYIIDEEIVALVDKLLKHKCITKKQHKHILIKSNLL